MKVSIVIPCYNSKNTIGKLVNKLDELLNNSIYNYEIILIDDGSTDGSFSVLTSLANSNNKIIAKRFSENYGQHAALMAAYTLSSGDILVGLNDDMEHDPADIFKLIDKLNEGYDYVCSNHNLPGHSIIQKLGSKLNNLCCIHLLGQPRNFYFSSFYAMKQFLVKEIIKNKNPFLYINGIILQVTKNVANVDIPSYHRESGKSGYSLKKSINLWLNSFTSFSSFPLRISGYVGVLLCLLSVLSIIISIALYTTNYSGLLKLGLLFTGIILFTQGIICIFLALLGEYVGRSYMLMNGKPQFTFYPDELAPNTLVEDESNENIRK